jgi:hypothetical protein
VIWLQKALVEDEDFGTSRDFHRLTLHWSVALGLWMRDGELDVSSWSRACQFCALSMTDSDVYSKSQISRDGLDDFMALCILAGEYGLAIAEFEKYYGPKQVSLKLVFAQNFKSGQINGALEAGAAKVVKPIPELVEYLKNLKK